MVVIAFKCPIKKHTGAGGGGGAVVVPVVGWRGYAETTFGVLEEEGGNALEGGALTVDALAGNNNGMFPAGIEEEEEEEEAVASSGAL
jgi:hypothetical protein